MSRENKYTIKISFSRETRNTNLFKGEVPYVGSRAYFDNFSISNNFILIEAYRNTTISLESIFYNHTSSLYNQIIKSLLFYYSVRKKFVPIDNIEITRSRNDVNVDNKIIIGVDVNQVLNSEFSLSYKIDKPKILSIFEESPKGKSILIAISYFLIANNNLTEGEKFEKLWKSFNKLYKYIGDDTKEFECLRKLKVFIDNNNDIPIYSSKVVSKITAKNLRNSLRWRAMFLDIFEKESKTTSLKEFILRYSDKRIMEIVFETKYCYRKQFLKNKGYFDEVQAHVLNHISKKTKNDVELVTLLTGKYMYFVRNKTFHGEKVDIAFRLAANKEEDELGFLNNVLESYIADLINSNNRYHVSN